MSSPDPLLDWTEVATELIGFLGLFMATGAVGFRFAVVGRLRTTVAEERAMLASAASRAAWLGLIGAVVGAALLVRNLPEMAGRQHTTVTGLLGHVPSAQLLVAFAALVVVGYTLVVARVGAGWAIAAVGVLGAALRAGLLGRWAGLINPVHAMAGGLWIGTLLMVVVAGLPAVGASALVPERRGGLAAEMVRAFSPLALCSAALLATMGVITAWRHLHRLDALWTTPYGYALIAKLCAVLGVLALGAYNWRRQSPRLGDEPGTRALGRSASTELIAALVVLILTAILVSLPSPKG
jgi:copper transport protein